VNGRVTDRAVGGVGIEAAVECRSSGMAAETQVSDTAMGEHMPVRASVDFMTGRAAFNPRREKGPPCLYDTGDRIDA
jgi:hypothetical protein